MISRTDINHNNMSLMKWSITKRLNGPTKNQLKRTYDIFSRNYGTKYFEYFLNLKA